MAAEALIGVYSLHTERCAGRARGGVRGSPWRRRVRTVRGEGEAELRTRGENQCSL